MSAAEENATMPVDEPIFLPIGMVGALLDRDSRTLSMERLGQYVGRAIGGARGLVVSAARALVVAKRRYEAGDTCDDSGDTRGCESWLEWCEKFVGLKERRVQTLLKIGRAKDPYAEYERHLEQNRDAVAAHAARQRDALANAAPVAAAKTASADTGSPAPLGQQEYQAAPAVPSTSAPPIPIETDEDTREETIGRTVNREPAPPAADRPISVEELHHRWDSFGEAFDCASAPVREQFLAERRHFDFENALGTAQEAEGQSAGADGRHRRPS